MSLEPGEPAFTPDSASPLRWRGAERCAPDELVTAICTACGQAWLVHADLVGFRIRCRCQSMLLVVAPAAPGPAQPILPAPLQNPLPARLPLRPSAAIQAEPHSGMRVAQQTRGINRMWIQLILLLAALMGPNLLMMINHAGPGQDEAWPITTLATGVLVTAIGLIWPKSAFSGLRMPPLLHLLQALALGLGCALLAILYVHAFAGDQTMSGIKGNLGLPAALLVVALCPGIYEELAFRGILHATLTEVWGRYLGWIATATAFALCHGITFGFPFHVSLGLLLGWLRMRSGSLYPGMVLHTVYNGVLVVASH